MKVGLLRLSSAWKDSKGALRHTEQGELKTRDSSSMTLEDSRPTYTARQM